MKSDANLGRKLFRRRRAAFTLIELLVVLGIIAMMVGLLMPALNRARAQANSVKCQSNLRQVGVNLMLYLNYSRGWLFPVGPDDPATGLPSTLGTNVPREQRWPVHVFDPPVWNPPVMLCPTDFDPEEEHSYVLNKHLADHRLRFGNRMGVLSPSEVVWIGEKVSSEGDYYMERDDFHRIVEPYRHGSKLGSNYLYLDTHVSTTPPNEALAGLDPWDAGLNPTTGPTTPP